MKDSDSLAHHGKEMPPTEVATSTNDILKNAREMLGKGNKHSEELGKEGGKPITQTPRYAPSRPQVVDSLVNSRPARSQPPPTSVLVNDLNSLATPKPKPAPVVVPPPKPTPKVPTGSLEDVVEQVADNITAKVSRAIFFVDRNRATSSIAQKLEILVTILPNWLSTPALGRSKLC